MQIREGAKQKMKNGETIMVTEVHQSIHQFRGRKIKDGIPANAVLSWDFGGKHHGKLPGHDINMSLARIFV